MSASPEARSYLPPEKPLDRNSKLAYASLAMGFTSWIIIPFLAGIAAIVLGHKARLEIARSEGRLTGDGLAVAGLVMGYANVVFIALIAVCIAGLFLLPVLGNMLSTQM
jgi:hypothetical protein